ncbi:MAG TPA: DUF3426 domain-containing protein, partial [Luteimonas sp.]|nr:DUF3426 domain-containing protein [Luteimonas sp.]
MFILCPHCQFLVALEPVTGQPPEQCPRCGEYLQPMPETAARQPDASAESMTTDVATAIDAVPIAAAAAEDDDGATFGNPADAHDTPEPSALAENPAPATSDVAPTAGVDETADEPHAAVVAIAEPATAPDASRPRHVASASARHRMAIASIPLLAVVLLLQSLLSDRARLAADARWRPAMTVLCDVLPCTLPPWREPAAFTLLERDVRPDPRRPGVLHVSAGFRNDARWPQPWPALLLTLSDADGRVAGARAFRPGEYLGAAATENGLASGQSAKVSFDVV